MRAIKLAGAMILVLAFSAVAVATASAAETLWRWLPGAAKTAFTGTSGKSLLQVKGGLSITSPKSKTTGEITEGSNLGLALITFETSTTAGLPVNSLGDASGLILVHLELHNCLIKAGHKGVLIAILPLHLEVPSTKLLITIEGDLVALVPGTKGKTFTLNVEQKEGVQAVEKCEGGTAMTLKTSDDGGAFVQSGQETKEGSITFTSVEQEAMES
jgi:hypothetical protein